MVERRPRRRPRGGSALTAFCCHRGERGATHGVRPTLRALPRPLCRYASIILLADDTWLLTELSNVVAYPCRHSRAEDRHHEPAQAFFAHLQPTTSVSATKVFPRGLRPPAIAKALAEIAGIAEIASAGNSVSPSSAQRPRRTQRVDLGRAVAQFGQHRVGVLAVPGPAAGRHRLGCERHPERRRDGA